MSLLLLWGLLISCFGLFGCCVEIVCFWFAVLSCGFTLVWALDFVVDCGGFGGLFGLWGVDVLFCWYVVVFCMFGCV